MEPELYVDHLFGVRGGTSRPGPGLLLADCSGVYSTARPRYIRKTRYHRYRALAMDLVPLVKAYRSLQKLGMSSWPELNEGVRKEITLWKHRVMVAYWDAMPEKRKASAIERYFRARYQRGMVDYPFLLCGGAVIVGGGLLRLMLLGRFKVGFDLMSPLLA